jgi:hypothetical protein
MEQQQVSSFLLLPSSLELELLCRSVLPLPTSCLVLLGHAGLADLVDVGQLQGFVDVGEVLDVGDTAPLLEQL